MAQKSVIEIPVTGNFKDLQEAVDQFQKFGAEKDSPFDVQVDGDVVRIGVVLPNTAPRVAPPSKRNRRKKAEKVETPKVDVDDFDWEETQEVADTSTPPKKKSAPKRKKSAPKKKVQAGE